MLSLLNCTEVEIAIPIEYEDYENHLVDQNTFSVVMVAKVLENDFHYAGIDNFRLRMPDINIEVRSQYYCNHYLNLFSNQILKPFFYNFHFISGRGRCICAKAVHLSCIF